MSVCPGQTPMRKIVWAVPVCSKGRSSSRHGVSAAIWDAMCPSSVLACIKTPNCSRTASQAALACSAAPASKNSASVMGCRLMNRPFFSFAYCPMAAKTVSTSVSSAFRWVSSVSLRRNSAAHSGSDKTSSG